MKEALFLLSIFIGLSPLTLGCINLLIEHIKARRLGISWYQYDQMKLDQLDPRFFRQA